MVVNFQDFKCRKEKKQAYRSELVEKILRHFDEDRLRKNNSFYLEHVRTGFPIHVLEGILKRIEASGIEVYSS